MRKSKDELQSFNQVFDEALEQPADERAAFITRACEGDEELRRRVEAMLAADAQAELLLDRPAHEAAAELFSAETSSTHESEILSGHTIGSYRLLREIGRGGMGKVYLAHDERLDRRVALKLLPARLTDDADRVARFQREARAASALNHPNILTIYDFGQQDDRHYIAAEFVEGRTLRALISQPGCTLQQALDITIQVASALNAAHAAGIVHRDIKPENVMLRPDGFVKVLDFGLAKLTEVRARDWDILRTSAGESGGAGEREGEDGESFSFSPTLPLSRSPQRSWATRPGLVMGTIAYMSPEQARGLEVDARSDLFSLGVVLYEMLTGERPFTGETPTDVLAALIEREPPPLPSSLLAEKPAAEARADLQRIVSRALAKSLDKRYQTASEMLDELKVLKQELDFTTKLRGDSAAKSLRASEQAERQALADQPTSLSGQVAARPATKPSGGAGQRRRLSAWALAAFALLMVGVALASYWLNLRSRDINSIAILPFVNVGSDQQMEYLSDGITESVIDSLSPLPSLRVMARSTVFTYKGREVDPRRVGQELQVRALVLGRVMRQGERLVIHAELVDTSDGSQLWGEVYALPLADLLAVKDALTREITEAVRPRLSSAEQRQLAQHSTTNGEAYQLYLKGNHLYRQNLRETYTRALDYYNQAIALDPRYALAYAGIANIYAIFSSQYLPPSEAMPKARESALQAITLDERLPEAHVASARVKLWGDWDLAGAEQECKRAIELNPNFVEAISFYSGILQYQARFDEALREARRAEMLDILSPYVKSQVCAVLYHSRQYDRLIEESRKALDLNPTGSYASGMHLRIGLVFSHQQMHQAAIAELLQAVAQSRSDANLSWLAYVYARAGRKREALEILHELEGQAARHYVSPVSIARIYVGLGDKERALLWLRKAYDQHSDHVLIIGVDPIYDPLRSDPRFIEMLRGIGLTP